MAVSAAQLAKKGGPRDVTRRSSRDGFSGAMAEQLARIFGALGDNDGQRRLQYTIQ